MNTHDFYEGVRAVVVDKDRDPKWNPSAIEELDEEYVASFFQYQWKGSPKYLKYYYYFEVYLTEAI
ncbi:enoyl-CoA hydratase/isomerase family protein [Bacillus sp. PAMC26568]|nr:enoyl-CoA hydratase/isomerase family protein [Bacillus sp. PAMC26568]